MFKRRETPFTRLDDDIVEERAIRDAAAGSAGLIIDQEELMARGLSILEQLLGNRHRVSRPVASHASRLSSGDRGFSLVMLRVLRSFYQTHGGLNKLMGDVCKEEGFLASVCELTVSTGLSLAESIERSESNTRALVGHATSFFSYSWTGTRLEDMLSAIERQVLTLEADDGVTRYVWIDMFAASQNLLAGAYIPAGNEARASLKCHDLAEYKALKEDTDNIFDDALAAVRELLLYCSPLTGAWPAPPHALLLPERGDEPPLNWTRCGPGATTRAWCLFEISSALAKGCRLHVVLSPADVEGFAELLMTRFQDIASIIAKLDARDAQISKVEDRVYILGQVAKVEGGLGSVTASVCAALREWLAAEGRALLTSASASGRPRDLRLLGKVGQLLQDQGKLFEAEPYRREALTASRATLGDKHADTLGAMSNLASLLKVQGKVREAERLFRQVLTGRRETFGLRHSSTVAATSDLGSVLQDQGRLDDAEPLHREVLEIQRETLGNNDHNTMCSISKLGLLLKDKGNVQEAEELYREALAARRRTIGDRHPSTLVSLSTLAGALRDQGKLMEARKLLVEALAASRETLGPSHRTTLRAAGRLSDVYRKQGELQLARQQLDGVVEAAREARGARAEITLILEGTVGLQDLAEYHDPTALRAAVQRMRKALGWRHHITMRYEQALGERGCVQRVRGWCWSCC